MGKEQKWKTIKTVELPYNREKGGVIEWINIEETFPEYRLYIGSPHLEQHVEKNLYEIANTSGMKATTYKMINYYDMPIEVLVQKRT